MTTKMVACMLSIGPRPSRERLPSDGFIERARQHLFLITFWSARV